MTVPRRRVVSVLLVIALVAVGGWAYVQSLVPAIHPDHDHGLENLAGGGFLRVEKAEGGRRNLVGRPGRVLILHWFEPGSPASKGELPLLVDYLHGTASDPELEIVLIATGKSQQEVREWAANYGVPVANLHIDKDTRTGSLMGVRRIPETLIYDPEGRLAHQARGPMNWADPETRDAIAHFKHGAGEHTH